MAVVLLTGVGVGSGVTGVAGVAGVTGVAGVAGVMGVTGVSGVTGTTGVTGVSGVADVEPPPQAAMTSAVSTTIRIRNIKFKIDLLPGFIVITNSLCRYFCVTAR
jgi:hypothetical protein